MHVIYNNSKVAYREAGQGDCLVLLHGFCEDSTMWANFVSLLSKKYFILTIDLSGFGKSDLLKAHSIEAMSEAVYAVVKNSGVDSCVLTGHSMGGYVALAFAEKNIDKIKGFCLMNSTSLADDTERKKLRIRANKLVQKNFKSMVQLSFTNLFSEQSRITYQDEMKAALNDALKTPVQGYIACQEGMIIRPNREPVLQQLSCKKLLILGRRDPVLDLEISLKEAKTNKLETILFDDGHMSHIENKNELTATLKKFISSIKNN